MFLSRFPVTSFATASYSDEFSCVKLRVELHFLFFFLHCIALCGRYQHGHDPVETSKAGAPLPVHLPARRRDA